MPVAILNVVLAAIGLICVAFVAGLAVVAFVGTGALGILMWCCTPAARLLAHTTRRATFALRVAGLKARAQVMPRRSFARALPTPSRRKPRRPDVAFDVTVCQNEYLAPDGREVHAVITIRSAAATAEDNGSEPERAEIILLDCSGSMGKPWAKLRAARHATGAALDALPDGAWFAVVRGNHRAEVVFPTDGGLANATQETRQAAKLALRLVWPEGGTAMGRWLLLAVGPAGLPSGRARPHHPPHRWAQRE